MVLSKLTSVRQKVQMFRALRHRNFRWFWFSGIAQSAGVGMQQLTLSWLVLELTDSVASLGLVVFLQGVPMAGFLLFGGVFADRIDRRKLLIASQLIVIGLVLTLATLTINDLVRIWHIYITAFLTGIAQAFNTPTRMAFVRDLVEREDMLNAVSLNAALNNISRVVGPFVAGTLIDQVGLGPTLYINASCYLVGIGGLLFLRGNFRFPSAGRATIGRDLLAGLRYVWSAPPVLTIILLGFAIGFFGHSYIQVMPAFAKGELGVGASGAGLLMMGGGLGALTGNVFLASVGDFRRKNILLVVSFAESTVFLFCLALVPWFGLAIVVMALVEMGVMTSVSLGTTLLQLLAPPALQGRVLSMWMIGGAFLSVGALPLGFLGDQLGLRPAIAGAAVLGLISVMWLGVVRPTMRRLVV
ncbi:MAG: MFS transporter [Chloroflexi bacterium]|nr:MFS transporter [Chloroflexota bacterium]